MSQTSYSDHPVLNELFDDEPTDPGTAIGEVQRQLDASESVVGFMARARSLGYGVKRPEPLPKWMTDLNHQLDAAPVIDGVEVDA